jgi:hypothetical protein
MLSTRVRQQTGLEVNERLFFSPARVTERKQRSRKTLEDAEMKLLTLEGSLCYYVDMFQKYFLRVSVLIWNWR